MKAAAIIFASLGLALAGTAIASERFTDLDYLKANRCKGLAAGLGGADTAGLDAMLKTEGRIRSEAVLQMGADQLTRGKRDAGKADLKERTSAELKGPCMAYLAGGKPSAASR